MKRFAAIMVLLSMAAMVSFAEGQTENWGRGYAEPELVTMTGKVYFEDRMMPELVTSDGEYELMVPRVYQYRVDVNEGDTITVEGYLLDEEYCRYGWQEGDEHIQVTKAVINGEEYELEAGFGPMGMMFDDRRFGGPSRGGRPMGRRR